MHPHPRDSLEKKLFAGQQCIAGRPCSADCGPHEERDETCIFLINFHVVRKGRRTKPWTTCGRAHLRQLELLEGETSIGHQHQPHHHDLFWSKELSVILTCENLFVGRDFIFLVSGVKIMFFLYNGKVWDIRTSEKEHSISEMVYRMVIVLIIIRRILRNCKFVRFQITDV